MNRVLLVALCLLAASTLGPLVDSPLSARSQAIVAAAAHRFDVASIRPVEANSAGGPVGLTMETTLAKAEMARTGNGVFRSGGAPLSLLIQVAYQVEDFQVVGGPGWIRSDRYAIDAKGSPSATPEQMRAMLQSLLADRFGLSLRRETRRLPVFELRVARELKIVPTQDGGGAIRRRAVGQPPDRVDRIEGGGITMRQLVDVVSADVGRVVIDRSGFTAPFNLTLEFAPAASLDIAPSASSGRLIFAALEEQLGLRLVPAEGPVDVLVVDRAQRPSEN